MKKTLFIFILSLFASVEIIFASNTSVDGIYYDFNSSTKTATVTYAGAYRGSSTNEYKNKVIIPATVLYSGITYAVTGIGSDAFYDCPGLTSVTIPSSVTSIGSQAFDGCSGLTSVTIPNSVTGIGSRAFYNCRSLTSVTIPNSVTRIGELAFVGCSSLISVTIPNSVTSIGDQAFQSCSSLTSVTIDNGVTIIGNNMFSYCSSLTSITIPNSVTTIGSGAFSHCSGLTSVTIPNSVTTIGDYAFSSCTSLISVTIPNSVTSIGSSAFGCENLVSFTSLAINPPSIGTIWGNNIRPVCYIPCGSLPAYATSSWKTQCSQFIEQSPYTITLIPSDSTHGVAKVTSRPDCESAILTAIPNEGCKFVKWSDGNTQATRYLELTGDVTLTAEFVKEGYTIHVNQDCSSTLE